MLRKIATAMMALLLWQGVAQAEMVWRKPVLTDPYPSNVAATKKGYVVVDANPLDKAKLKQYGAAAKPLVLAHGGKFIAKRKIETLHGGSNYKVKILIEFPSLAKAKEWYFSPEYQKLIPLRSSAMDAQFHLID